MSKNTKELPATELVERAAEISRMGSVNDTSRIWGALNDVYVRELPSKEDWTFLLMSSALTCTAPYTTGTITATTQNTTVTFSADATITAAMTGRKIKLNTNPNIYDFTYANATGGTLNVGLSESVNATGDSYSIFQPVYGLATDFDRFPKNGGLQLWQGQRPTPIPEDPIQTYYTDYQATPARPSKCRLVNPDTAGTPQVELVPAPDKAYLLPYDFLYRPQPLRETTQGTVTTVASATTATFHAGARLSEMSTGMYLRVNAFGTGAHSEWYRILAINQATSAVTLTAAWGVSGATSAGYTVCSAPQYPILLHNGLLEGTVLRLLQDQNDPSYAATSAQYNVTVATAKKLFKSRVYNQEIDTALQDARFRT